MKDVLYETKITLKELSNLSKKKVNSTFNNEIRNRNGITIIRYKEYSLNQSCPFIMKNIYIFPDIQNEFITVSNKLLSLDINNKTKGYYLKLIMLSKNNLIDKSNTELQTLLSLSKNTITKYNKELINAGLISTGRKQIKILDNQYVLNNSEAVKKVTGNKYEVYQFVKTNNNDFFYNPINKLIQKDFECDYMPVENSIIRLTYVRKDIIVSK
jgi:hypothetical protein